MGETVISVEHIDKIYKLYDKNSDRLKESLGLSKKKLSKDHYALRDVSFYIGRGETVGIIGTNGSGKSTILKIITGVLNPTHGKVNIRGRISALLELGAGFNMEYTGLENVYLNGTMIGFTREEIDAKLDKILSFADIGDFINQPVKTYSSGMFVRLAFAVAINIEPEILIVDEALSVGDVFFQAKCYKKFEDFKAAGKTILFVSHDLGSIGKYCDRAILLNKGSKMAEGTPAEIIDLYKKVMVGQEDAVVQNAPEVRDMTKTVEGKWYDHLPRNPNTNEYGDRRAEIIDYAIVDNAGRITNCIIKGDEFSIKMKIRVNQPVQNMIMAFTIKDLKGTDITGTNTLIEKIDFEIKEENIATFTQKMNLQGGEYLLSLGCTSFEGDNFVVYHRLYDVCNISVVSDKNTVGFCDMDSRVLVE